jgi:hypothetical protein
MTGWITKVGGNTVNWNASKQNCVALSTAEAEYIAAAGAAQEIVWAKGMLEELGLKQGIVILKEDNQSCISMTQNPIKQTRTKHVDIKYHFIRGEVKKETLKLEYCPTKKNLADILTKPLNRETHNYLKGKLGVVEVGFRGSVVSENQPREEKLADKGGTKTNVPERD